MCPKAGYSYEWVEDSKQSCTVFPLIEAGSQIQAGSLIQAGPLIEAGGLNSYNIELGPNCTPPSSTVVHSVIRAYCVISTTAVWPT